MSRSSQLFEALASAGVAERGSFRARPFSDPVFLMGIDEDGLPALLVRSSGSAERFAPILLSNLSAVFAQRCRLQVDSESSDAILSTIRCISEDDRTIAHFLAVCDSVVAVLGAAPTTLEVRDTVQRLASLFLSLLEAPRTSWTGLVGELAFLRSLADIDSGIAAWRPSTVSRFDFIFDHARVEAKATTGRTRRHMISFEQVNPIAGSPTFFSSVFVEYLDHGFSVADLIESIAQDVVLPSSVLKLHETVASTLGNDALRTAETFVDLELLRDSLRLYKGEAIPAIREDPPLGVSRVTFESDFSLADALTLAELPRDLVRRAS